MRRQAPPGGCQAMPPMKPHSRVSVVFRGLRARLKVEDDLGVERIPRRRKLPVADALDGGAQGL